MYKTSNTLLVLLFLFLSISSANSCEGYHALASASEDQWDKLWPIFAAYCCDC